jgi:glycosyltransferase involved in cell wall biosynthesis
LLPTRDRLDLLKLAIESVRMQDHADWELIVSDNASASDVVGYVRSLEDARIKTRRFEEPVSVTKNWNAALELATGDYFIMLGDDDALLPGALSLLSGLVAAWQRPEAIYGRAEQYAYPGVMPDHPDPMLQVAYNEFLEGKRSAFRVPRETALRMARAAIAFRTLYGFNMQHFVISRAFVERLRIKGPFFQSPYPDYYAANAVMVAADPLVATPENIALIGISPKSFGFYYVNQREAEGEDFLKNMVDEHIAARVRGELVPGSNLNDSWLYAMETLVRNFAMEIGAAVCHACYRRRQYYELLKARSYRKLLAHLRWWEFAFYGSAALVYFLARILPTSIRARVQAWLMHSLFSPTPRYDDKRRVVPYRNILEAARSAAGLEQDSRANL